jgi:hypothetical protein
VTNLHSSLPSSSGGRRIADMHGRRFGGHHVGRKPVGREIRQAEAVVTDDEALILWWR